MSKLATIRKTKSLLMKWRVDKLLSPFESILGNSFYMSQLSRWRAKTEVKGYNDWYRNNSDYQRRINLYNAVIEQEDLNNCAIDYFEFGVSGGVSFKWWLQHQTNNDSRFYGFDTFEGLPESYGYFAKGEMAASIEGINVDDKRAKFFKGLFQNTLLPFLKSYQSTNRKVIHLDADLFSATLFTLTQLYPYLNKGDILIFDEFGVPTHEFRAFKIFADSFYLNYEVIAAANNYLFLAVKILKD